MKRGIKTIIALSLVGCMTIGGAVMTFAETIESSDTTVTAGDGETVNVVNDVEVSGEFGVQAQDGGTVNVGGDVTNHGMEYVGLDGEPQLAGEGVQTMDGGTVTVEGNVSAPTYGALADKSMDGGSGSITIKGNVSGSVGATDGNIEVGGNVVGTSNNTNNDNAAIEVNGNSNIHIGGDVTSSGTGVSSSSGSAVVVIEGTLNVADSSPVVALDHSDYGENGYEDNGDTGVVTLVVYEINGGSDDFVKAGNRTGGNWVDNGGEFPEQVPEGFTENASLKNEQIKNIFYIVKKAEGSSDGISSLSGTTQKAGYDTATENTVITVKVKEGYGLSAGSIKVTSNADGSYTLTVPRGGGVTLSTEALQKAVEEIEQKEEEKKEEEKKEEEKKEEQKPEQQKAEEKKEDKKDDDSSSSDNNTPAAPAAGSAPAAVSAAPVSTLATGFTFADSTSTLGANTSIRMDEPGPAAAAAFAAATPAGYTKAFVFSVTDNGQTSFSVKNGRISFKIPAQFLLNGRKFKLMGIDKDSNVKVFNNAASDGESFEADVDVEGYQFELIYAD